MSPEAATEVAPDVWRVTTPLPFRPRSVHAYLVRLPADRWLLVDGGANTDAAWSVLDGAVHAVTGGWHRLALHLVTHMHLDHVGLAERTRNASAAPLAMGGLDAERAAHAAAHPEEEAEYRMGLLRRHGAPAELLGTTQPGREPLGSFVPADLPLPCDIAPLDGAPGWTAVWTPGHTAGHVALLREADGVLLAGDALLPRITPTIGVNRQREDPVGDYLDTLDRLEGLAPRVALGGHGEPLADPAERARELRRSTREETEHVASLIPPRPTTAWEVVAARYAGRDLPPSAQMLALREILAHLQHLVRTGRAASAEHDGLVRFSPL